MSLPDQTPKLPKWPFLLIWAAFLIIAAAVAWFAPNRFAPTTLIVIFGCVAVAAIAFAIPFLTDYAHTQNEALDERQRSLDALARTVTNSAEQISIAANGLNEIAELTQKSLRHADHLPQKLHEKVAEMQALLATVNDAEKEELEREVAALRTTESDRLEAASDKIAKSAAEWTKLEAATQKHLAAAAAALDEKLAALDAKIAALSASAAAPAAALAPAPIVDPAPAAASSTPDAPTAPAHPPKRPRKPRREEPSAEATPASEPNPNPEIEDQKLEEPPPVPTEKIPEVAPVAPHTAEPFVAPPAAAPAAEPTPAAAAEPNPSPETVSSEATGLPVQKSEKPPRKRAPKKPAPAAAEGEPSLGLVEPPAPPPAAEVTERAISSDGATRLLVTAYIGIGNRLFIRGEGPGLSWEKGVPLQFVSIGKWRWETTTATTPVKFKLYKNDDIECAALGTQSLDPGQQQEVTAAF